MTATSPAAPGPPEHRPRPVTVLVVDDRADIRGVVDRNLTDAGYTVVTAATGADALLAAAGHPDPVNLLLTALNMPGLSGDETAARFRVLHPNIRVLLMSGYALLAGPGQRIHPVLDKPFTRVALLTAVTAALNNSPADPPAVPPPSR